MPDRPQRLFENMLIDFLDGIFADLGNDVDQKRAHPLPVLALAFQLGFPGFEAVVDHLPDRQRLGPAFGLGSFEERVFPVTNGAPGYLRSFPGFGYRHIRPSPEAHFTATAVYGEA